MTNRFLIGIDPGIISGFAVYDRHAKAIIYVSSFPLHLLFDHLNNWKTRNIMVFIENPNMWSGSGKGRKDSDAKKQGAGAVKQTYKHIKEFLEYNHLAYLDIRLEGPNKKMTSPDFRKLTGWTGVTNGHGRDAAMMCYNK